jgi:hypothetical protein
MLTSNSCSWYLYMDTDGGHCIIRVSGDIVRDHVAKTQESSQYRVQSHDVLKRTCTAAEIELGIQVAWDGMSNEYEAHQCSLYATSFEEFLVRHYFFEWIYYFVGKQEVDWERIPPNFKEFMVRVYTVEGRSWPQSSLRK